MLQFEDRKAMKAFLSGLIDRLTGPAVLTIGPDGTLLGIQVPPGVARPERPVTECEKDILTVLEDAGQRLTGDQIVKSLQDRGLLHGDSTVKLALARLRDEGRINNDPCARPRGYALPVGESVPHLDGTH